jgi:hypothetical protein
LLSHFDTRHENKKGIFLFSNIFWKAAAILVLLGCGWLLNYLIPGKKASDIGLLTMIDTVYVNKEIMSDPLKIYDTIYIEKKSTPGNKTKDSYNSYTRNPYSTLTPESNSTLNFEELVNPLNRQKRNSMKDDSLVKEFSAIML